jgi:hypothetical protein
MVILARDFRQVGSPPNPRRAFFVNRAAGGAMWKRPPLLNAAGD